MKWIDFIDKLGSDATIPVDGRLSIDSIHQIAYNHAQRLRKIYSDNSRSYQIIQGSSLNNAQPITNIFVINIDRSIDEIQFNNQTFTECHNKHLLNPTDYVEINGKFYVPKT